MKARTWEYRESC